MSPRTNILLVDDRSENLIALQAVLEPLGHNLITAASGEEALKQLLTEEFSVILLDVQMPGMDGFETATEIKRREKTRDVPIIFLTAISRDPSHVLKGYSTGAVDYIPKPFDPDALRAKVSVFVELHEKNELLREQARELERSNDELQQFAYIASHDLREPLRVIIGYLDLLKEDLGESAAEGILTYVGGATSSAERMQALIDDLLQYSRVGSESRSYERVDLNKTVTQVLQNLGKAVESNEAEVLFEQLPNVQADQSQICQVLQNLIANAIKFKGDDKPMIHIKSEQEGDRWIVSVSDNGVGFEQKDANRVFEIFQRLHGARMFSGTGIGLAVCKKIIDQHGGRIWAESQPGKGTTFSFSLPAAQETA